jgi:hypothetical protein
MCRHAAARIASTRRRPSPQGGEMGGPGAYNRHGPRRPAAPPRPHPLGQRRPSHSPPRPHPPRPRLAPPPHPRAHPPAHQTDPSSASAPRATPRGRHPPASAAPTSHAPTPKRTSREAHRSTTTPPSGATAPSQANATTARTATPPSGATAPSQANATTARTATPPSGATAPSQANTPTAPTTTSERRPHHRRPRIRLRHLTRRGEGAGGREQITAGRRQQPDADTQDPKGGSTPCTLHPGPGTSDAITTRSVTPAPEPTSTPSKPPSPPYPPTAHQSNPPDPEPSQHLSSPQHAADAPQHPSSKPEKSSPPSP